MRCFFELSEMRLTCGTRLSAGRLFGRAGPRRARCAASPRCAAERSAQCSGGTGWLALRCGDDCTGTWSATSGCLAAWAGACSRLWWRPRGPSLSTRRKLSFRRAWSWVFVHVSFSTPQSRSTVFYVFRRPPFPGSPGAQNGLGFIRVKPIRPPAPIRVLPCA